MGRISREEMYLEIAKVISKRASCQRASVGAVITQNNRIVSCGYNGPVAGSLPCNEHNCNLNTSCEKAVHAEMNAILAAAKVGISLSGAILYCTHSPCFNCSKAIIQAGIKEVIYLNEFRETNGLLLLSNSNIRISKSIIGNG